MAARSNCTPSATADPASFEQGGHDLLEGQVRSVDGDDIRAKIRAIKKETNRSWKQAAERVPGSFGQGSDVLDAEVLGLLHDPSPDR